MSPDYPSLDVQPHAAFNLRKGCMYFSVPLLFMLSVLGCAGIRTTQAGTPDQGGPAGNGSITQIEHIVIMVQENRSFDNYFGKLNDYRLAHGLDASVDGLPPNAVNPTYDGASTMDAYHLLTACTENSSPSWNESHADFNRYNQTSATALMDGFVYTGAKFAMDTGLYDTQGRRVMGYYDWTDIPYYYFLATQFATSDRWFSPVGANSPANHFYLFAGTSGPRVRTNIHFFKQNHLPVA